MRRRTIREQLFKLLSQIEFMDRTGMDPESVRAQMHEQAQLYFDSGDLTFTEQDRAEILTRCDAVMDRLGEIDKALSERIEGWQLRRVGKVELALLRIAVYEILYDSDIPAGVSISEAVELAGRFGPDGAGQFVNGVLGRFARESADDAAGAGDGPAGGSPEKDASPEDGA